MAGPHKRTRSETAHHDENPTTTTPRTTRRQAQAAAQAQALTITPPSPDSPPSTGLLTPNSDIHVHTRTTPTRSNTTPLHRTTSLFTRRTNNSSHNATPFTPFTFGPNGLSGSSSPSIGSLYGSGGARGMGQVGMLTRTQSVPSLMASPSQMKLMSAGGVGGVGDKGEGPSDYFGLGGRKFGNGRGKENIPPSENGDAASSSSRKRLRVGRSNRGRSGSVSSLRSETPSTSGRPSIGPTHSFSRMTSRLPSPAPSTQSSTPTQPSFDSASIATSSADAIDLVSVMGEEGDDTDQDDMELDKTPTKSRARPKSTRYTNPLPTPPLSSPTEMTDAVRRMELVRMQSDASITSIATETSITSDESRPSNPYKYLKSFLRLSSSQATSDETETERVIVGRAPEKHVLKQYLASQETEVGMYISGPPGTGKTALVTAMGRDLRREKWNVVEFGCMGLKVVDMWKRLAEGLGCGGTESEVKSCLENANNTLIILDEIDSLLPPSPALPPAATSHLLSKLFALPLLSSPTRSIKLVAISNTLDLTIRARISLPDNHQPRVLPFKAYGAVEMSDIMLSRIASVSEGLNDENTVKVDTRAVELLTRKVEATNGDLRNCLGCLTSAVTLAEMEWIKKPSGSVLVKVSLPHTIKAFNSHTQQLKAAAGSNNHTITSATGKKVKSVPLQGKMVLVSILVWIARTRAGLTGIPTSSITSNTSTTATATPTKSGEWLTTSNLFTTYTTLLSHHSSPFPPSHESDYRDLLSNLEVLGLVKLQSMAKKGSKVELCAKENEIKSALGLGSDGCEKVGMGMGMADDEVRKVYEREDIKIKAAVSKAERSAAVALLGEER